MCLGPHYLLFLNTSLSEIWYVPFETGVKWLLAIGCPETLWSLWIGESTVSFSWSAPHHAHLSQLRAFARVRILDWRKTLVTTSMPRGRASRSPDAGCVTGCDPGRLNTGPVGLCTNMH